MTIAPARLETDAERAFREGAEAALARAKPADAGWRSLLDFLEANGLPDRHNEMFHYTDVRARLRSAYPVVSGDATRPDRARAQALSDMFGGDVVTFVNGLADAPPGPRASPRPTASMRSTRS